MRPDPVDEDSVRAHMQRYFAPDQPDDARQQIIDMILPMLPRGDSQRHLG